MARSPGRGHSAASDAKGLEREQDVLLVPATDDLTDATEPRVRPLD